MHPDQLFEVNGGNGLGDQLQQWWTTFEKVLAEQLGFDQHPMDPCVFILREPVSRLNELHDDVVGEPLANSSTHTSDFVNSSSPAAT